MKRLLVSFLALIILACASPVLADRHGHDGRDVRGGRDDQFRRWHQGHARYRHWHGRQVTYWNGHWGYWQPSGGIHVFIGVSL